MNYNEMSKDELIKEIKRLKSDKSYGLIWEEKPENMDEILKENYPVLTNVSEKDIINDLNKNVNLLIEGDNLHSLELLYTTHEKNIDCILIDPPYNTGNKDFIYNDQYIDKEDNWRHSKWISFMHRRLSIARKLLKEEGVIFIHIDENEFAQLKLLCDEVFDGNNFIGAFIWKSRGGKGGTNDKIATEHEYIFCYAKNYQKAKIKTIKKIGKERREQLRQWGQEIYRENRPYMFFPLLYKEEGNIKATITDEEYQKIYDPVTDTFDDDFLEELKEKYEQEGWNFVLPIREEGYGRWRAGRNTIKELLKVTDEDKERIEFEKDGDTFVAKRVYPAGNVTETAIGTLILDKGTASDGTKELKRIFGEKVFDTTKPLDVTIFLLDLVLFNKSEGIVLDFFAGSGTVGEAVLKYNKDNNKNFKFILCTNNEMKEQTRNNLIRNGITPDMEEFKNEGVCRKVTYPKLKSIIEGYEYTGKIQEVLAEEKINKTFVRNMDEHYEKFNELLNNDDETYSEVKVKVINDKIQIIGVKEIESRMEGYLANLKYYITDIIPKNRNKDQMKIIMAQKIYDLLCIKENCFELVKEEDFFRIYRQGNKILGIYTFFRNNQLEEFKKEINKLDAEEKIIYSFSFTEEVQEDLFNDIEYTKVKAIPNRILEMLEELRGEER
ncbi:MAG TPA: hypothetical protein DHM42_07090 [Clostridiales bacterium]|jgi:adenine-specific DNA-methyltransferase|nr:hypothetical protein [Clostridiales bacterium]